MTPSALVKNISLFLCVTYVTSRIAVPKCMCTVHGLTFLDFDHPTLCPTFCLATHRVRFPLQLQESVEPAQAFALVWNDFYSLAAMPRANGSQALVRGVGSWFPCDASQFDSTSKAPFKGHPVLRCISYTAEVSSMRALQRRWAKHFSGRCFFGRDTSTTTLWGSI